MSGGTQHGSDILKRILRRKVEEIAERSAGLSLSSLSRQVESAPAVRPFLEAIEARLSREEAAIIAEIKRASPSKGVLREDFHPAEIAASYARHGATCLSVLTDEDFFHGSLEDLKQAREACALPVLRKDFIVDAYQVYESRVAGADCILLIVAALGDAQLLELSQLSIELGMDVLVEVHDRAELERALTFNLPLIGINNRNLQTFETTLDTTLKLLDQVPQDCFVVTESGIHTAEDVSTMRAHGVNAFLVGEAFMKAPDPGRQLAELFAVNGQA